MMNGPHNVVVMDFGEHTADIATYDVNQSNDVIRVIDTALLPK